MLIVIEFLILIFLFYVIGSLIYKKDDNKKMSLIKVFVNFFVIMFSNAVLIFGLLALLFASFGFIFWFSESSGEVADVTNDKFPTVQFLIILFIFILVTAIIQFLIRGRYFRNYSYLQLDLEEYELCEYFIQWMTIYIVVYQFLFDGFSSVINLIPELKGDYKELFVVLLSPNNINAVLQPLLISTWIVVVMEKIKLRNKLNDK